MAIAPAARTSHPPGLYVLFFTELWERYSFYSMSAILTLYMNEALHFGASRIGAVYGGYIGGVYFMPLIGGLIAGRALGFFSAGGVGGGLMVLRPPGVPLPAPPVFFSGPVLLPCGTGLLQAEH